jgi:hypothetical protein
VRRSSAAEPARENLAGLVERVTFHNEDNGFCVSYDVLGRRLFTRQG